MDGSFGQVSQIQELEEALLDPVLRRDVNFLATVLADEFREFGSSGTIYTKPAVIGNLQTETPLQFELLDFSASVLGDGVVLTTYRTHHTSAGEPAPHSLRSSVWVWRSGRWQMIFHQGTKTGSF